MVKITEIKTYRPVKPGKLRGKAASDSFSTHLHTQETQDIQTVNPTQPLEALNQLMQVQEIGERQTERKKALLHGEDLLSRLNRLQADLLAGTLDETSLAQLAENLKNAPRPMDDPELKEIIDRIHQRAEIELAKIAMTKGSHF